MGRLSKAQEEEILNKAVRRAVELGFDRTKIERVAWNDDLPL